MTDQEIRDALRVDPSPEFLARVRTRIAGEPAPSAWRWSWTVVAGGALAAAVVVALVMLRTHEVAPAVPQPRIVQGPVPVVSGTTAAARTSAAPAAATRSALPVVSGFSRTVPAQTGSELVLDPAETRALRGLIAGVRDGRVDLTAAQHSTPALPMELAPLADIVIDPITIEPIAPPSGAGGARP